MKLKSFRVQNYKSIIDSGICRLSDNDFITILAGQNESGKSSILQALRDFGKQEINVESLRDDDSAPIITCTFSVSADDFKDEVLFKHADIDDPPERLKKIVEDIKELEVILTHDDKKTAIVTFGHGLMEAINIFLQEDNVNSESGKDSTNQQGNFFPWNIEETIDALRNAFLDFLPTIIFFDDFCDLLPEKILLKDITSKNNSSKGYQAVRNVEKILSANFSSLEKLSDSKRETTQNAYHESITADFNEKWKQRIAEGNGAKVHVKFYRDETGTPYLKFYIETKKGEFLSVNKRSQGFKWFLSFYLQLKAEDKNEGDLIILFDEPGLYLHSKAQTDMIAVFEELSKKNQIIYSTHSPYLIDTAKLHRVRLVLNTKDAGTTVEKITSSKISNQKDSLKPIIDALGLEIATPFSVGKKNNVIVEGISDFHYLQGMKLLLNKTYDIGVLPSMGASNCHL
ncbi:MAG: AAA family ATPase [Terrimonas sp.]|nr:AAA family ATPase [Terrimonas sp.]